MGTFFLRAANYLLESTIAKIIIKNQNPDTKGEHMLHKNELRKSLDGTMTVEIYVQI